MLRGNCKNRMVREEGITHSGAFQLLQIIPEGTSRSNIELLPVKVGSGFEQDILLSVLSHTVLHSTLTFAHKPVKRFCGDRDTPFTVIQYHWSVAVKASHSFNEGVGEMLLILLGSPCRILPVPFHLPVKSGNG